VLVPFVSWDFSEQFSLPKPFVDPDGLLGLSEKQVLV
jgi:hypothetical protein